MKKSNAHKSRLDRIRESFNKTSGGSDADKWLNVPAPERGQESKLIARVMPPWGKSAEGFFYYTAGLHYGFTIGGRNRALACPESVEGGMGYSCPICKFIGRLRSSDDKAHDKLQMQIRQNRRYWVNMINQEEPDAGIRIFGGNKKFIEAVLDAGDDPDVGDITDLKTGRDIIITRRGFGLKTRYSYRVRTKATPVSIDVKDLYQLDKECVEWISREDMIGYLVANYSDELKEVGLKFAKKADDEEEEKPKKKAKLKLVKKSKKVVEEEEDDEDEIEDEIEEAEDEDEEQDEEDETGEDDEEDEE